MAISREQYATAVAAFDAFKASERGPEDVKQCIGVVLPIVREGKSGETASGHIAQLLRVNQLDAAMRLFELAAGKQSARRACPSCRAFTDWKPGTACSDCGFQGKSHKGLFVLLICTVGPFLALMAATAGAAIVPSSGRLAASFLCNDGEQIVTTGSDWSQPDGSRGTNYTSVCHGPAGDRPVGNGSMMMALFAIYLIPGIVIGVVPSLLLVRRLEQLGH